MTEKKQARCPVHVWSLPFMGPDGEQHLSKCLGCGRTRKTFDPLPDPIFWAKDAPWRKEGDA